MDTTTFHLGDWENITFGNDSARNETQVIKTPNAVEWFVIVGSTILVLSLNSLMFAVVRRMKTVNKSTTDGMVMLGIADFTLGTMGAVYLCFNIALRFEMTLDNPICTLYAFVSTYLANVSIVTLTFLNVDKLFIFAYPLRYPVFMTSRKFRIIMVIIWVSQVVLALPPVFNWDGAVVMVDRDAFVCMWDWRTGQTFLAVMSLGTQQFPTYGNIIAFLGIICIVYRRKVPGTNATAGGAPVQQDSKHTKNIRLVRTLALMTLGYYVAWIPLTVYVMVPALFTGTYPYRWAHFFAAWIGGSNSFWNPIIYMMTMRPFQEASARLVRCKDPV